MIMTPIDYYREQCQKGLIFSDPQQHIVLQALTKVYLALQEEYRARSSWKRFFRAPRLVQGVYIWGSVGIGKTFLMDCFFYTLPLKKKMRMHFHSFMRRIHHDLKQYQGEADPLVHVAKELAKETLVLCFDEFYVSDIADAMIFGRLLKALFDQRICLVATSNLKPDDLYKNGLQRSLFLPAIDLLKKNLYVLHVPTQTDYRLRHLKEAGVFYTPLDHATTEKMEKTFTLFTKGEEVVTGLPIEINGRLMSAKKRTSQVIWFDFSEICTVPRSQNDYLAIAETFSIVFISDVPVISEEDRNTICLFVSLVDVFYDARIKLVISAAEPVSQIYQRGFMILEYTRTHSRLLEMQSIDYFMND